MKARIQSLFGNLGYIVFWFVLAGLAILTVFQLHTTWIAIALSVIENTSLHPREWNTDTIHGLGRVFWLVLGILWLGWVMFTEGHLREGKDRKLLIRRFIYFLLILGGIYGLNYLILLILP